jgi:hypothetical protein
MSLFIAEYSPASIAQKYAPEAAILPEAFFPSQTT